MKKNLKIKILICTIGVLASAFLLITYYVPEQKKPEEKITGVTEVMEVTEKAEISEVAEIKETKGVVETKVADTAPSPEKEKVHLEEKDNMTLVLGEDTISLSFIPDSTFYDVLVEARDQGKINFNGKDHPALGYFVTEIGSLKSGDGNDLLYYVNGEQASVGVSDYKLKDGDIIEWKLE